MILKYTLKLSLKVYLTNIKTQKIDNSIFKMFKMVVASFQVKNKFEKIWFFLKMFLLADLNIKIVLKTPFFIFNNTNI